MEIKGGSKTAPEFAKLIEKKYGEAFDVGEAPDEMRLSQKISQMIDPYKESMDLIILVDCAAIAWNECVAEDYKIKGPYTLNKSLFNYAKYRKLIDELKVRKRMMYNQERKHIREIKVYDKGDKNSINVAYDVDIREIFTEVLAELEDKHKK